MRSSNKSRSRNKSSRNRSNNPGNVVNRVFDSSGPEGKVRGTPQQIIDKYQTLARDAQLSGDRVAAENFLQHAEHYVRMLSEAQKEIDARREQQEQQRQNQQNKQQHNQGGDQNQNANQGQNNTQNDRKPSSNDSKKVEALDGSGDQPSLPENADLFPADQDSGSNLVDTPESKTAKPKPAPRKRTPKPKADKAEPKPKPETEPKVAE